MATLIGIAVPRRIRKEQKLPDREGCTFFYIFLPKSKETLTASWYGGRFKMRKIFKYLGCGMEIVSSQSVLIVK